MMFPVTQYPALVLEKLTPSESEQNFADKKEKSILDFPAESLPNPLA